MLSFLKKILNIIRIPFIVPTRINRISFANNFLLNIVLLIIVPLLFIVLSGLFFIENLTDSTSMSELKSKFSASAVYSVIALSICFLINVIRLQIARLHDMNFRGFWILLLLIPLINFIPRIVLLTVPGTKGENRFGQQADSNSKFKTVLGVISGFLIINFMFMMLLISYAETA